MVGKKNSNWWDLFVNHSLLKQERGLLLTGGLGIVLGVMCLLFIAVRGAIVLPEGDLFKAVSFNIAVGVFIMTTAILLPFVVFPETKKRTFRRIIIIATLYSYGVETIQHARGINPRFSQVGSMFDSILGGIFGLMSLSIIIMYVMLAIYIFNAKTFRQNPQLTIGLRYGIISTLLAFASGIWMILLQGRFVGMEGNIIWLHGLGFHGIQAMPLLAWLALKATFSKKAQSNWIHCGGFSWNLAILLVGLQTALGKSIFEPSIITLLFYLLFIGWIGVFIGVCRDVMKNRKVKSSTISEKGSTLTK